MSTVVTDKNITSLFTSTVNVQSESNEGVRRLRNEALAVLESIGLPSVKNEEYKHTPLTRLLEKNLKFPFHNVSSTAVDLESIRIPSIEGVNLVFINGKFSAQHSSNNISIEGLTISSIKDAVKNGHELIGKHFGKIADHTRDGYAAYNTAAWTDGVFVHVKDNVKINTPIIIYNIHDAREGQVVASLRNLIVVGRSSEVTIFEKLGSAGESASFSTSVTEAVVNENAGLNYFSVQNDSGNRYHFDYKQANQSRASRVNTYTFTLDGKAIRNSLQLSLDGEGIDSHMYGLYLIGKDSLADNHTVVDHKQPNSFSNELYKGIMEDNSKGVFNGKIYVRPNAQKTNAFQANRNILLSDKASVNTKPQLEIWADDVKCSHGCTSGQLDEEALFYLRARGINKDTARAMMLYAFAAELLETIKNESIRSYIDDLISQRLHKNF